MICRDWERLRVWGNSVYMLPYLLIKDIALMRVTSSEEVKGCVHREENQRIENKGKAYIFLTNWLM